MLISNEYKVLNSKLHESRPDYGTSSAKWVRVIKDICLKAKSVDVLDYGCGKSLLKSGLGGAYEVSEYDPAIPGKETAPEPHDVVVCTDVMEHIEPDCLDSVLDDLKRLTKKYLFLTVATRPAKKFLEDGRNAHLIQKDMDWWRPKLDERFKILSEQEFTGNEFIMLLGVKC